VDDFSRLLRETAAGPARSLRRTGPSQSLKDAEQHHIISVLESVQGNRTHAARLLGISLRTLHYRMKVIQPQLLPAPQRRPSKAGDPRPE